MTITGTHFNYYQFCHRKLWLFANGIKVDYYDAKNKVIHEIKKSNKMDKAHELSNTLPDAKAVEEIMGIEGNIRQTYYAAFDIIIDDFNMGLWKSDMTRRSVIVL